MKIGHHVLPGAVTGDCAGWPLPVAATGDCYRWPLPVTATGGRAGWLLPVSAMTPLTDCSITRARLKRPRAEKAHRANE